MDALYSVPKGSMPEPAEAIVRQVRSSTEDVATKDECLQLLRKEPERRLTAAALVEEKWVVEQARKKQQSAVGLSPSRVMAGK